MVAIVMTFEGLTFGVFVFRNLNNLTFFVGHFGQDIIIVDGHKHLFQLAHLAHVVTLTRPAVRPSALIVAGAQLALRGTLTLVAGVFYFAFWILGRGWNGFEEDKLALIGGKTVWV